MRGVAAGFGKGLELMNQARALGPDAKYRSAIPYSMLYLSAYLAAHVLPCRLRRPDLQALKAATAPATSPQSLPRARPPTAEDVPFRAIVEEELSAHDLLLLPTGKSLDRNGAPLFRVSAGIGADGRGGGMKGVTVYMADDVIWLDDGAGQFTPVWIQELVDKVKGSGNG